MSRLVYRHEWDMGHRLPLHQGKCRRLHGHRYVAEIHLTGPIQKEGPATGMVVDFYELKNALKKIVDDEWDHKTMLYNEDPLAGAVRILPNEIVGIVCVPFMPTAENIAAELLRLLRVEFPALGVFDPVVEGVRVWETPNGSAIAN